MLIPEISLVVSMLLSPIHASDRRPAAERYPSNLPDRVANPSILPTPAPLPAMNGTASQGNGDGLQSTSGAASRHMVPTNGYSWGDAVLVPQPFPARRWLAGTRYLLMPEP